MNLQEKQLNSEYKFKGRVINLRQDVALLPNGNTEPQVRTYNIYEGSYIVEAGIRYDDIEVIEDDIEELFARAEAIELEANELIAWADTNF